MDIKNEKKSELLNEIIITITAEDYAENVEKALKKERRTAQIPGFRIGNAPMAIIKKHYERHFTAEEVNRLLSDKLYGYLRDNNLKILGEPLPIEEKTSVDFDKNDPFVFAFEYALEPEVNVDFGKLPAVKSFKVVASDTEKEQFVDNLRNRYGEYITPEAIEENDSVSVKYGEDKDGFIFIKDLTAKGKKAFIGKKKDDEFKVKLKDIFADNTYLARFMKVKAEEIEEGNNYETTIKIGHVGRMVPAEINDDFFKKAYPDGTVTDIDQLNALAAKEIEAQWAQETDRYFMNNAISTLIDNVKIDLPDEFLKRFILGSGQKDVTAENIDEKYESYRNSFKWQLLENKLVAENKIEVKYDDVKGYIRDFFVKNYFSGFNDDAVKEQLDKLVADALKNQEDVKRIYDQLYDKKIMEVLHAKMKVDEATGNFEDFVASVSGKGEEEKSAPAKKKTAAKKPAAKKTAKAEKPATKETKE